MSLQGIPEEQQSSKIQAGGLGQTVRAATAAGMAAGVREFSQGMANTAAERMGGSGKGMTNTAAASRGDSGRGMTNTAAASRGDSSGRGMADTASGRMGKTKAEREGPAQEQIPFSKEQTEWLAKFAEGIKGEAATQSSQAHPSRQEMQDLVSRSDGPSIRSLKAKGPAGGTTVRLGPNGSLYAGPAGSSEGTSDFDWSKVALGYKIDPDGDDPDSVRIYAGEIDRIAVAQPDPDITVADDGIVYIRRTIADDTMLVATAASVPANDATYRYYRLYQFSVSGGAASIKNIYRPFDIEGGSGYTGDLTIVTAVTYASLKLTITSLTATFDNGMLTSVTAPADTDVLTFEDCAT